MIIYFFFSSRRRHTRWTGDWSSDVCSSDLGGLLGEVDRVALGDDRASTVEHQAGDQQQREREHHHERGDHASLRVQRRLGAAWSDHATPLKASTGATARRWTSRVPPRPSSDRSARLSWPRSVTLTVPATGPASVWWGWKRVVSVWTWRVWQVTRRVCARSAAAACSAACRAASAERLCD